MTGAARVAPAAALARMRESTGAFVRLLEDVEAAQASVRPAGEEWSLVETVEHVVVANRNAFRRLAEAAPFAAQAPRIDDDAIPRVFERPAPPDLARPTGRFATLDAAIAALSASCDEIARWTEAAPTDLRALGAAHPLLGMLDGVQWILFIGAHTDNHVPQLRKIRAALGLPP